MAARITNNQPKPFVVLTRVQSESGSWEYEIRTSLVTGETYCTCKGYAFRKHCKHMDAYKANPVIKTPTAAQMPIQKARTPGVILREELQMLGLTISEASANAISLRVLAAGGKSAKATTGEDMLNAGNVRVIVLPD